MNDDFELPPLPKAADIPMTLSDIDHEALAEEKNGELTDVNTVPLTDMENKPVDTPAKTDYKAANRRKHMAQDMANDRYLERLRPPREKVSVFKVRMSQGKELEETGRKRANRLLIAFIAAAALSSLAALSIKSIVLLIFETVVALFFVRGTVLGRIGFVCACGSNILMNIIAIAEKFVYSIDEKGTVIAEYTGSVPAAVLLGLLIPVFIFLILSALLDNSVAYYCRGDKPADDEEDTR